MRKWYWNLKHSTSQDEHRPIITIYNCNSYRHELTYVSFDNVHFNNYLSLTLMHMHSIHTIPPATMAGDGKQFVSPEISMSMSSSEFLHFQKNQRKSRISDQWKVDFPPRSTRFQSQIADWMHMYQSHTVSNQSRFTHHHNKKQKT